MPLYAKCGLSLNLFNGVGGIKATDDEKTTFCGDAFTVNGKALGDHRHSVFSCASGDVLTLVNDDLKCCPASASSALFPELAKIGKGTPPTADQCAAVLTVPSTLAGTDNGKKHEIGVSMT